MQLYILKGQEKVGPLELQEVRDLLNDGKLVLSDQAWHEGSENWAPLSEIPGVIDQPKATIVTKPVIQKTMGPAPTQPMSSIGRDVKNLKANTTTTATEVRAFLSEMQGKSPREMLGIIAQSNLGSSLVHSAAIIGTLLAGFTVLAIASADDLKEQQEETTGDAPTHLNDLPDHNKSPDNEANTQESINDDNRTPEEKAAEKMGVDKAKKGQPKEVNPFGNKPGGDILGEFDK